jgi:hypothetical protein
MFQITIKYTKSQKILPDGHQIGLMAVIYTDIFHRKTLQNLPKLENFGLKTNHLATQFSTSAFSKGYKNDVLGGCSPTKGSKTRTLDTNEALIIC